MLATFSAFLDWWFSSPVVMNTVATVAVLSILLYGLLELTAGVGPVGRFDFSSAMSEGWHVFNNLLVSLFPLLAAFVGIALLGLVLRVVLGVVRRSED